MSLQVLTRRSFGLATSLTVAAALTAGALIAATANAQTTVGATAPGFDTPDFTVVDTNGVTHSIADFADKTVVLEWTNHQCPYVVKHYATGNMQALQAAAAADEDIVWLQIISSAEGKQGYVTAEEANALNAERNAVPTATIIDASGEIGRAYGARTTPHMFVIENGTIAYQGAIDDKPTANHADVQTATNFVSAALASVAAGEAVEVAETSPYGCSIKYGPSEGA